MRLQPRLALTTAVVAAVTVAGLFAVDVASRHRAAEETLARITLSRLDVPGARGRCEGGDELVGDRPGPPSDSPVDSPVGRGAPQGPRGTAPPPGPSVDPPVTRAAASADADLPALGWVPHRRNLLSSKVAVLVRTPWDGPCAYVVTRGSTTPGFLGATLPTSPAWLLSLLAAIGAVVWGLGPAVRRLERLAEAARTANEGGFRMPARVAGDDEIGDLARAISDASEALAGQIAAQEAREQALRDQLANTTHDVMLPMTVLMQHLAVLRAGAGPELSPTVAEAMGEATYLAALLDNLAVAARIDGIERPLERVPVDLGELVERVVSRHRVYAGERGVQIEAGTPEEPVRASVDVAMFERALSNLVHNAIAYNREGGHVAVTLARDGAVFLLHVLDDGPGVPDEELDRILDRGYRGRGARSRGATGHGLGLHITRTVLGLHGLGFELDNRRGRGLVARVEGPVTS